MKRVLLISNASAGSVSRRTKEVIAKALSADFKLEVADTEARNHASELAREGVVDGYDAVLAFGGDGTINEVAQGVVGTDVALGILPGGSTNVFSRTMGIPPHPVDATAFVAAHLRSETTRRINVGRLGHRYFLFAAGMGLDAEVVKRIEANPAAKSRYGKWGYLRHAVQAAFTRYRGVDPQVTVEVEGHDPVRAILVVCCNARPLTYFGRFPVDACPEAHIDGGLDALALSRIRAGTIPRIAWSVFVSRAHVRWKTAAYFHDFQTGRVTADRPLPAQVDGDYLGEWTEATLHLVPEALDVLA